MAISRLQSQRGGALIVVMMVGTIIAIGFAGFITSSLLVEARAVEASLARSRAYWAEMGNYYYALSRISKSKFCNSCVTPSPWPKAATTARAIARPELAPHQGKHNVGPLH